ncbi:Pls/PosA family non-ribosomal peptide synthetase [Georgenia yuyongxinii]|uniref:Amino acid adenylation domain-containing protein n=1 Tax=Georgenia yuyongxinii TaxID=2589797 RepID=A0A552WUI9_9MICO|nr:Pls/PosA family non-ribosomal peptide synthetase [Georgenia yuyongxinii]TRW46508.1 amino acid adenylation domain-containing protein [Georgenia yuyongxinii]
MPPAPLTADPLLAADRAPEVRTLVDIFEATAARHPTAIAIDDGDEELTYAALLEAVRARAARLTAAGVRRGDRVGIRATSGAVDLYLSILASMFAGAAYVPVDADDPDERATIVWAEAGVVGVVHDDGHLTRADGTSLSRRPDAEGDGATHGDPSTLLGAVRPTAAEDAWIIFTSGSTGKPKGVAVSHRSAAAWVDAEARLFLRDDPLRPGDRVLAGLSVAFDASCEEMWLAWRHGATLVPAPRALVRTGTDLGPWLVERDITVVSTVPTLAGMWPVDTLDAVRLLIFGGEAIPPELATRLWRADRELWNTYGPTEATVIACAALLEPDEPVRIGLPQDGWNLAVVDAAGEPVAEGETGELIIGGVGLARYLDPDLDAKKFAPMPALGWERAYRSGDLVQLDRAGLIFVGRADDQVKVNGRRIELGEVDSALLALPGVAAAAAAVQHTPAGTAVLVGYVVPAGPDGLDTAELIAALREELPAAMIPLLAVVGSIPTRTSGKVDRDALPWPLPGVEAGAGTSSLTGTEAWVGEQWAAVIGVHPSDAEDDFFSYGGSSLTAAQLVSALRVRYPLVTVAEVYRHPEVGDLAAHLEATYPGAASPTAASALGTARTVRPVPAASQLVQLVALVPLRTLVALRWLTVLAAVNNVLAWAWQVPWAVPVSWWWVAAGWLLTVSPLGRMGVSALGARLLLAGVGPGTYPRGGGVHLRLWAAERLTEGFGAVTTASAPWVALYARALGVRMGRGVDLHAVPPVTGLLTLGRECAVEPEVDLAGHWVDGDQLHVGRITVGPGAVVGARSVLYPGAHVGAGTDVAAGSAVHGRTGEEEYWAGSPATRVHQARHPWPPHRPPQRRAWQLVYALSGAVLAALPVLAVAAGLWLVGLAVRDTATLAAAVGPALIEAVRATLVAYVLYAAALVITVRLLGIGLTEGFHPVRSRVGWQAWCTERLMDSARTVLFPLYSSVITPAWLRLLGAHVGANVEASTVIGLPSMMRVKSGAFLADDTMVAPYELGGGWVRVAPAKVGRRAFLGNSGMTAPGRTVPKNGLVAVLSATPAKTRAGSSYIGSPPVLLPRAATLDDGERTFAPPARLRRARALVEVGRVVPALLVGVLGLGVVLALQALVLTGGWGLAAALGGVALLAAGVVAAVLTILAKRLLVGRVRAGEHPLWSSFVWRGEVADTFTEMLAAPYFADAAAGTVALVWWLRGMGARIGRGVWCQTYWLPEADLVHLGDGATVGPGCVVQTHLFHDRIMSLDVVTLGDGATLGPHGVILPAATLGAGSCVGPASLVMRGEGVPAGTRWVGNPIAPWQDPDPTGPADDDATDVQGGADVA